MEKLSALILGKVLTQVDIPLPLLKKYSLCRPLCIILNKSVPSDTFPTLWKSVIDLQKLRDKDVIENYRGICKLLFLISVRLSYDDTSPLIKNHN